MLHAAEPFLEKNLHPTVIVRGYTKVQFASRTRCSSFVAAWHPCRNNCSNTGFANSLYSCLFALGQAQLKHSFPQHHSVGFESKDLHHVAHYPLPVDRP